MTARRATISAVAGVLGAALLMILLVTWAASIGPDRVLAGDGPATHRVPPPSTTPPTLVGSPTSDIDRIRETATPQHSAPLRIVAGVIEVVVVVGLLFLAWRLARWLWQTWNARSRPEPTPEELDFEVLAAPEVVTRAILDDAEAQRLLLAAGSAHDAIVECWHRFETQASTIGMSRRPWETSSEFTLRVLELVAADTSSVALLAGLYREARFSEHRMTEDDRAAAIVALGAIHDGLRVTHGGVR